MIDYKNYNEVNPKIMMGKPVIKGTRLTVEMILVSLNEGETIESLLAAHPRLTKEAIYAAFSFNMYRNLFNPFKFIRH